MLTPQMTAEIVARALAEDAPWGDITVDLTIPADLDARLALVAREPGVYAGGALVREVYRQLDDRVSVTPLVSDGERFSAGDEIAMIQGPARAILTGERVALNLVQRLSGIATLTASFVSAVDGTRARIADTRKTTPGLRALEKHAVRCGGGVNHRFSLSDAVMVKDNHLAAMGVSDGEALTRVLSRLREQVGHTTSLIVEVDRLGQLEAVLAARPDGVLLDNFSTSELAEGVRIVAGRATVEASGGVSLKSVAEIAATGVDVISVGALTHSARALDLGLDSA